MTAVRADRLAGDAAHGPGCGVCAPFVLLIDSDDVGRSSVEVPACCVDDALEAVAATDRHASIAVCQQLALFDPEDGLLVDWAAV